jgi:hypothetical protein
MSTGANARQASAAGSPDAPAISPAAGGPRPPASPAALLSVTATWLRPGRLAARAGSRRGQRQVKPIPPW